VIVAILGGSNGAYAMAADLALGGQRVRLWRPTAVELEPLGRPAMLTLDGEGRGGKATLEAATADLAEAVRGAEVVVIAMAAPSHEDLARRLAPHLTERQIVLLAPGTLGSVALAQALTRAGGGLPSAIAETGTRPYLARETGPAAVSAPVRAVHLPVGVFPASRSARALAPLAELFPATRPCADALDAALTSAAPVLHPPIVLLNLGAIDRGPFDVHAAGATATVRRLLDAVDAERIATRQGWGYAAPHYEIATYHDETRAGEGLYGKGARSRIVASGLWNETVTLEHRYVTEDAVLGLSLFESAARTAAVLTPATSGLLSLFGVLLGRDLSGRGRALEQLGLGDLTLREIRTLLVDGWDSPAWSRVSR
jgi:opine dehydrogenase